MKNILFIFGTRPEAIKLAPLIKKMKNCKKYKISVCITAQHRELLDDVLNFFNINSDYDLNIMQYNQSLTDITVKGLDRINKILKNEKFDLIIVQGDTTSTFIGALAGFYNKIDVAHIEAGLRSFNKFSPYPEEINRVLTSKLVDYHFSPTLTAKNNLIKENIKKNVWVVGNTAIDALFYSISLLKNKEAYYMKYFSGVNFSKKIILVTAHRRENIGQRLISICNALKNINSSRNDIEIVYPVHPNPSINKTVYNELNNVSNIHLMKPLIYPAFVWLMNKSFLIMTDSGGIQEEAPTIGKPVLVLRDVTERNEVIETNNAILVGAIESKIVFQTKDLLDNKTKYNKLSRISYPYGRGLASEKILNILKKYL